MGAIVAAAHGSRVSAETAPALSVDIVDDDAAFRALKTAWEALAARVPDHSAGQTYAWCRAGWDTAPADGRTLQCITVRSGGRLVGVWPFVKRRRGLANVLEPLGSGGHEEYGGPLVEDGPEAEEITRLAWRTLRGLGDVVILYNIRVDAPLNRMIGDAGLACSSQTTPSPIIEFAQFATWADYEASRSTQLFSLLRRRKRKLERMGRLSFAVAQGEAAIAAGVDWLLSHKRNWMDAKGLPGDWLRTEQSRAFLALAAIDSQRSGGPKWDRVQLFLLTLDDKPIAGVYALVNPGSFEFYIVANDPAYNAVSPGNVLIEHLVRWAYDRGLTFDFRMVAASYKERWSNATTHWTSFRIACTWRGLPEIYRARSRSAVRAAKQALARRLDPKTREQIKRLLNVVRRQGRQGAAEEASEA